MVFGGGGIGTAVVLVVIVTIVRKPIYTKVHIPRGQRADF